ncbi:hypothetical protein F5X68DRAFT_262404 [Plectosphaerella plurivora]|uniref:Ribosomal protein S21 n=1 Tax=Plectosphaerella plurivora TaxID=936078 RepID=A0A9P8VAU7_9PEZI|nr:hypothetical protein F5X68DRAFT_262404 [Plectosphaerella plurivora]
MTSEMRLASRRLLHAGALPLAPRALPRLAFPQIRAISTTLPCEAVSRPSWASRTGQRANPFGQAPKAETKPAAPASAPEPVPEAAPPPPAEVKAAAPVAEAAPVPTPSPLSDVSPFSKAIPTAASRSASSDYLYDATSAKTIDLSQIIKDDSDAFHAQHYGKPQAELRLHPVLGRTIHVNNRVDVATAVNYTNVLTVRNKIKFHYHHQRFHERPGLKRKRLRSERWRTKFKKGFAATVHRVQDLKAQGW